MTKIREQVLEFHKASNSPIEKSPIIPSDDRVRLRLKLIAEEFAETLCAALKTSKEDFEALKQQLNNMIINTDIEVDMVEFIDGLGDIDYVVEGTRIEFGVDGGPIAEEIQRSNMAKFGPGSYKREDGKVMKPPGWTPPDILGELKKQGWKK